MDGATIKKLYVNDKKSSAEIAKIFKCSERAVNYWLAKYEVKKRSISEAVYLKNNPSGDPFKIKPVQNLEDAKLFGLGLGLYWGEGNKKNKNSVRLGNTDPKLIKKFLEFLMRICGIEKKKLRFGLQVFSDMNTGRSLKFWLKELREYGINRSQFFKVTVTPARSLGNYREKSKWGVLTVHFSNTKLKKLLDGMLPL
ncbi:MAG: hypothetical protein HYX22_00340 [Candidatus Yanofskybacteria bacterium]|nr:hypothetical protein [Candidatus Yanofskybacteria bacterium]